MDTVPRSLSPVTFHHCALRWFLPFSHSTVLYCVVSNKSSDMGL